MIKYLEGEELTPEEIKEAFENKPLQTKWFLYVVVLHIATKGYSLY